MTEREPDVLVVGAGPTGLTLACELVRHGLSCRVIEELAAPVVWSKAAVVQARTMEVFDDMGVVGLFLERSKPVLGASVYAGGKRVAHVVFEGIDSPYPHPYGISQKETESLLAEHLARLGVSVERGRKLESFTQTEGGITAKVAEAGTEAQTVPARWIVGCDGAHSVVRKTLGFTFEGSAYEERIIQADVRIAFPMRTDDDEILAFLHPDGPVACFPLFQDGRYRLIVFLMPKTPDVEPTMENFQRFVDQRVPGGAKISDPAWTAAFRIHQRKTDRYRAGRAFVAGDAAHIHSPVGGQGMNTGIQDAYNLAWKLALVHKGRAKDSLLDSYEAERQPVAAALLSSTDRATRGIEQLSALRSPIAVELRNQLMGLVTSLSIVRSQAMRVASMTEVNYRGSPIVRQDRPSLWHANVVSSTTEAPSIADWAAFGDGPLPGDRAPDAAVGERRLFEIFRGTRHTLLLFDGAAATPEGYANLARIAREVGERWRELVLVHVIVPAGSPPRELTLERSILLDSQSEAHRRYGARSECLYLVRPDGYVAYRCQPADGERLSAYLASIFVA
jgi:2-polyprenyl-6-methoxyphenol hydroxylase-like FAD-dependent oxidoreductase